MTFNGVATTYVVDSATQIRAAVPTTATTGPVTVFTAAGPATSATPFTVTVPPAPTPTPPPAPAIVVFTPSISAVGGTVIIGGFNFTGATSVNFNGVSATFTVNSDTRIAAQVPAGATSGAITVTTPAGTTTGSDTFTVIPQPSVSSFSPASSTTGATIVINGNHLAGTSSVKFFNGTAAGVTAPLTVLNDTKVRVAVPTGARTIKVTVTTPGGVATSTGNFVLLPKITALTPIKGFTSSVTILAGSGFTGTKSVKFGTVTATFTVVSDTQLKVTVPLTAPTGQITVTTIAGKAISPVKFAVLPKIASFTPASGHVGQVVTINGSGLLGATAVKFGTVTAVTKTVLSATQIKATVPTGAVTGKITVVTPSGTAISATSFTVTATLVKVDTSNSGAAISTATANVATASVSLRFLGTLDAETASDAANYSVTVNGQSQTVESAGYNAGTHTVSLGLAEGTLHSGDEVGVTWNDLRDGGGNVLAAQGKSITAH